MSDERIAAMQAGRDKAYRELIRRDAEYVSRYKTMLREDADHHEAHGTWGAMRMAPPTDTQFAHYHEAMVAA